ncbi:MAG: hypothetical protein LUQ59_08035, partial [Methanothrix sp.]|nr:hypothetical protein [Methanothrix sp.]
MACITDRDGGRIKKLFGLLGGGRYSAFFFSSDSLDELFILNRSLRNCKTNPAFAHAMAMIIIGMISKRKMTNRLFNSNLEENVNPDSKIGTIGVAKTPTSIINPAIIDFNADFSDITAKIIAAIRVAKDKIN